MSRIALGASIALALVAGAPSEGLTKEKLAYCRIESGGSRAFNGKCLFDGSPDRSFHLGNVDPDKPLFGEIELVNVVIISPGFAQVRGLTKGGINSMWGEAHRSASDRACWEGSDFRICGVLKRLGKAAANLAARPRAL